MDGGEHGRERDGENPQVEADSYMRVKMSKLREFLEDLLYRSNMILQDPTKGKIQFNLISFSTTNCSKW